MVNGSCGCVCTLTRNLIKSIRKKNRTNAYCNSKNHERKKVRASVEKPDNTGIIMNRIIGVVGMCGSGKSVVTEYLEKQGWERIYFGGVTIDEVKRRGLEVNETNERSVREELRRTYGPAAYAILLKEKIAAAAEKADTVLDGLYSWQEYTSLKETFGDKLEILAVISNRADRYKRLETRPVRPLTKESATARDYAEIENLAKGGPIAIADHYVMNDGTVDELIAQINKLVRE